MKNHKSFISRTALTAFTSLCILLLPASTAQAAGHQAADIPYNPDKPYSAWLIASSEIIPLPEPHLLLSDDHKLQNMALPGELLLTDLAKAETRLTIQYPRDSSPTTTDQAPETIVFTPTSSSILIAGKSTPLPQEFNTLPQALSWNMSQHTRTHDGHTIGTLDLTLNSASSQTRNVPQNYSLGLDAVPEALRGMIDTQGTTSLLALDIKTTYTFTAALYAETQGESTPSTRFTLDIVQTYTIIIEPSPDSSSDAAIRSGRLTSPFFSPSSICRGVLTPGRSTTPTPASPPNPVDPITPDQPQDPCKPLHPAKPGSPCKTGKPCHPGDPNQPFNPCKPSNNLCKPSKPSKPSKPDASAPPDATPAQSTDSGKPTDPGGSAHPGTPTDNAQQPSSPTPPSPPTDPALPAQRPRTSSDQHQPAHLIAEPKPDYHPASPPQDASSGDAASAGAPLSEG